MAKFLTTVQVSAELEGIIREAKKYIYLVSPYQQINKHLKESLRCKDDEGVDIHYLYGKTEKINEKELSFLQSLHRLNIYYHEAVHAKCYMNEKKMIITSMNIYEYSERNNKEMGILLYKDNMPDAYEDAFQYIKDIIHNATIQKESTPLLIADPEFDYLPALNKKLGGNTFYLQEKKGELSENRVVSDDFIDGCKIFLGSRLEILLCFNKTELERLYKKFNGHIMDWRLDNYQVYWNEYSKILIYREKAIRYKWEELSEESKADYWGDAILCIKDFLTAQAKEHKLVKIETLAKGSMPV
jgi:hypothetical protein